jgi:hypothetical protein
VDRYVEQQKISNTVLNNEKMPFIGLWYQSYTYNFGIYLFELRDDSLGEFGEQSKQYHITNHMDAFLKSNAVGLSSPISMPVT